MSKTITALTESTAPATTDIFAMVVGGNSRKVTLANAFKAFNLHPGTNILEQRNGTSAQISRLYNTYTSDTVYERFEMLWSSNELFLRTVQSGGSARPMHIGTYGSAALYFYVAAADRWSITTAGHFLPGTDNTNDIGGATKPRTLYLGTSLYVGATKVVGAQGAAVADATGGATVDTEARAALNDLLAKLRTHGLIAT